jgi:hypothetical protein
VTLRDRKENAHGGAPSITVARMLGFRPCRKMLSVRLSAEVARSGGGPSSFPMAGISGSR